MEEPIKMSRWVINKAAEGKILEELLTGDYLSF
jgi:hypothetical protein